MSNPDPREGVLYKFGKKGRCRAIVARGDLPSVVLSPIRGFATREMAEKDARITARILNETYRDPGRQRAHRWILGLSILVLLQFLTILTATDTIPRVVRYLDPLP